MKTLTKEEEMKINLIESKRNQAKIAWARSKQRGISEDDKQKYIDQYFILNAEANKLLEDLM